MPSDSAPMPSTSAQLNKQMKTLRLNRFATSELCNGYRRQFRPLRNRALSDTLFLDQAELFSFYKDLELQSELSLDPKDGVILTVEDRGVTQALGVTGASIGDPGSDLTLAYKLLIAKVNFILSAASRNRVTVSEFEKDWTLLQSLDARVRSAAASSLQAATVTGKQLRFHQSQGVVSGSKKAQKLLMAITH